MLEKFLKQLWQKHCQINPQAEVILSRLRDRGEKPRNDHIAIRTFNDSDIGIHALSDFFCNNDYKVKGHYEFPQKKLKAIHLEHPDPYLPLVFLSELELEKLSPINAEFCRELIAGIDKKTLLKKERLLCSGRPWPMPTHKQYLQLSKESEYAAWLSVFGFMANHFTISVNSLVGFTSIECINEFVQDLGFSLNSSGGLIKGSPEEFLEQSSTTAAPVEVRFVDGVFDIPGCYYEFARRYLQPNGCVFHGFVAKSADKIFESTDRKFL